MKTATEIKFDNVIKLGFHELLKPLGFKKKANNFYLKLETIGQIINIQKSSWNTKDDIKFTINTGIFVPEYWQAIYNYSNKELPAYPIVQECLIQKRIGRLRNQNDTWYDIDANTDGDTLVVEMRRNLEVFILPYFERLNSRDKLLEVLGNENISDDSVARLIIYGESHQLDKARSEYERLLQKGTDSYFLSRVKEKARHYGVE